MTKLQEARKNRGLKAIDLCCVTKLHPATISAIENRRQVPGKETRAKLSRFFKISEGELFDGNGLAL